MLEKVLYLVNFETYEPELIRCLTRLKDVGCRELVLLHLPKTEEVLHHIPSLLKDDLRECLAEVTQKQLDTLIQLCQDGGMTARPLLKAGELAWIEVHQLVQHEAIALVVVGPFIGSHLGTVVSFLIPATRVPLLIVKVSARVAQAPYDTICQSLFGRVLYPTDWSLCASKALDSLISLKPLGLGEVIVTHVVAPTEMAHLTPSQRVAHRAHVQQQLAQTQHVLEEAELDVRPVLLEGDPARELVSLSAREDVALIVMGTTGKGMTAERTLGSVSGSVARATDRSLLLVCHTSPPPN